MNFGHASNMSNVSTMALTRVHSQHSNQIFTVTFTVTNTHTLLPHNFLVKLLNKNSIKPKMGTPWLHIFLIQSTCSQSIPITLRGAKF